PNRTLNLLVSEEELTKRKKKWKPPKKKLSGILNKYYKLVKSGSTGAILE
ncbi:MAG: dihydroxy-acid dehydratase, partial [Caldimicrobium sp.]